MLSSASESALTLPQSANVVLVDSIFPSASTSQIEIWTEAWSLATMRRSIWQMWVFSSPLNGSLARPLKLGLGLTGSRAFPGDVEIDEDSLEVAISTTAQDMTNV